MVGGICPYGFPSGLNPGLGPIAGLKPALGPTPEFPMFGTPH